MIIIGSESLIHWFHDFNRKPKDFDVIRTDALSESIIRSTFPKSIEVLDNPVLAKRQKIGYLRPDDLLTLKVSHIFWDVNFDKHMWDIQFLLNKGCIIKMNLFYELYEFWNEYHGKNLRSDLDMDSEDFFDNAIKNKIPHDTVHTFLNPNPTYQKILQDGKDVLPSEEKFYKLKEEEKYNLVVEEVQVMSWERWPNIKWYLSYSKMLKKFLMNHAPMYEAIWMIKNWKTLIKPPFNHIKLLNEKANNWLEINK